MADSRQATPERRDSTPARSSHPTEAGDVRVWLLGGFEVSVGSRVIREDGWRLRKAASLVKLLALAPNHRLHREQIMDLLWQDLTPRAAANNLHQALHVARRTLEPEAATHRHLSTEGQSLALYPNGGLWVDTEAFEEAAQEARRDGDIAAYRAALDLYAGDLLPGDRYEDWTESRRRELRATYSALLFELASLYEGRGDHGLAIEALLKAVSSEPTHEEAHAGLMRLYARTGQRHRVLRQYEQLRETLRRELGAAPHEATRRIHQEILAGHAPISEPSPLDSPPARPSDARRHNLSGSLTSFVGREREKEEVKRLLGTARLLTLTGTGGSGKTRLAREVARDLASLYPDGAWFVELAQLSDPRLIPQVIAETLEVRERPEQQLTETLVDTLREKLLLLILDNCEHLVEACAHLVETLLSACAGIKILATSRELLGAAGELTWQVPPLSRPDPSRPPAVEELEGYESVRLFVERARYRNAAFMLTPHNAGAVAEICTRLDGIPLAIELAAARVGMSAEQISARLDTSLKLLTTGPRTAERRQRTLRGTLDWSYRLLEESERNLFGRLSVFAGGWTLEAAEAACAGDGIEEEDVLDLLGRLVDKSLVAVEATGKGGVRYRMLETVRQYAGEKLEESGEVRDARNRHAEHYLALAEEAAPELTGPRQVAWLEHLEAEHDNLRTALAWYLENPDPTPSLRLAGVLGRFWWMRSHLSEGRVWLERALGRGGGVRGSVRAKALHEAGGLAIYQGDHGGAIPLLEESAALYREAGDERGVALATCYLGFAGLFAGGYQEAEDRFQSSLALARSLGYEYGVAFTLLGLGVLANFRGETALATRLYGESLQAHEEVGDLWGAATVRTNLGWVELAEGHYERAAKGFLESLPELLRLGDKAEVCDCLDGLAATAADRGQVERAVRLWGAIGARRRAIAAPRPHSDQGAYERRLASARSRLGEARFRQAWQEGQTMKLDQAVEYGLATGAPGPATGAPPNVLTRREWEIAALIARGLTNRQIASELTLSERTVETHVARILKKLGVGSRDQVAARLAEQQPLTPGR